MKFSRSRYLVHLSLPLLMALFLAGFGAYNLVQYADPALYEQLTSYPAAAKAFRSSGVDVTAAYLDWAHWWVGVFQLAVLVVVGLSGLRRPWTYWLILAACLLQVPASLPQLYLAVAVPVMLATRQLIVMDVRTDLLIGQAAVLLLVGALWFAWLVLLSLAATVALYWRRGDVPPRWADRLLENLRSHGPNREFRLAGYGSLSLHLLIILVIPWLLGLRGCQSYELPFGRGTAAINPQQPNVKVVKKKKKKPRRAITNPKSAIIFTQPTIDDSTVLDDVTKVTEETYTHSDVRAGQQGGMGSGGPGKGGWPSGAKGAGIRFIRLKYEGGLDWNLDMGDNADYNLLKKLNQYTGLPIAKSTEAETITGLGSFIKGKAPPFVFMTGGYTGGTITLSDREVRTLRKYLVDEGGMIFASCGSARFDAPFRAAMKRVLPECEWVNISHDDPVFQQPFDFPNGAHPFWHMVGRETQGLKIDGRWVVYYHPGDIGYAWRSDRGGTKEGVQEEAFKIGVNVIYYSFNQYFTRYYDNDGKRK